jgi:hypothetical protein
LNRHAKHAVFLFGGIAIVAASLFALGLVQRALLHRNLKIAAENGQDIYVCLFERGLGSPLDPLDYWPQHEGYDHPSYVPLLKDPKHRNRSRVFGSSTKFFQWVMDAGIMNVDAAFFGGPGRRSRYGQRDLDEENNIWCVTVGVRDYYKEDATPHGVPVLFTRNLSATNISQLAGPIRDSLVDSMPFGKDGVVIVLNGGASSVLKGKQLDEEWTSIPDISLLAHSVLRP